MSRLKLQLLEKLPEFQRQAKFLRDPEAKRRWNYLRFIAKGRTSVKQACMKLGISEEWFRKWALRLLKEGEIEALHSHSRAPRRSPRRTPKVWENRILMIRQNRPFEGCDRIVQQIFDVFGKKLCRNAVHKVLKRHGLVNKTSAKKLTKKHLKRYRRPLPGYLQMDIKYVPYRVNGQNYYQLSCVDHHSSWRLIRIYDNKGFEGVESFLSDLERECPFPIMEIQTDNDLAFTHKFWKLRMGFDPTFEHPLAEWCQENDVRHKLIPVGVKELNGKVENTHKQDDREFFSQHNPQNLTHLQMLSLKYEERWNQARKTKALGWKTPYQAIREAYVRVFAWWGLLGLPMPGIVIKIPKAEPPLRPQLAARKSRRAKRKSAVDRYLTWIEEDAKKYGKGG